MKNRIVVATTDVARGLFTRARVLDVRKDGLYIVAPIEAGDPLLGHIVVHPSHVDFEP